MRQTLMRWVHATAMRWVHTKALVATAVAIAVAAVGTITGLLLTGNAVAHPRAAPRPIPAHVQARGHGPLRSPFTGERVKSLGRELIVKIDNIVLARPQTGLTSADIMYVLPVEGGLTRFMAVFSSNIPRVIGPVRSTREDDIELLRQFNRPAFAFSGAQPWLLPVVEHSRIVDLYAGRASGYYRDYSRIAPYNLYADTRALLAQAKGASKAHDIGFRFGPAPPGGRRTSSMTVTYPAASYTFRWSKARQRWLVWMDGSPAVMTSGKQLAPATVVVQYVEVRTSGFLEWGNLRPPYAVTTGKGTAIVLRNGKAYRVYWSRPYAAGGTTFTTRSGQRMNFAPGQVWVVYTGWNRFSRANESQ
jgi:hypothetical protein